MFIFYEGIRGLDRYRSAFGVSYPTADDARVQPGGHGSFLRMPFQPENEKNPVSREALRGRFGLRPFHFHQGADNVWATYNAPAERIGADPLIHEAWSLHRHCLIPVESLVMTDWSRGEPAWVRIRHRDGLPMALGGLWLSELKDSAFEYSYAMLSIRPERGELLPYVPGPESDGRMPVIVPKGAYDDWLSAPIKQSGHYMQPYPLDRLAVEPMHEWPDEGTPLRVA